VRDAYDLPASTRRFADGGQYRIEIPSTEGPRAMEAVLQSASVHGVPIHRISQGSGIMLQTDDEIREMVALGRSHGVEVCLFVGPRANWDVGIQASSTAGRVVGSSLRGADQLRSASRRCTARAQSPRSRRRSRQLMLLAAKQAGDLPPDLCSRPR
jgi:hypothetical protein